MNHHAFAVRLTARDQNPCHRKIRGQGGMHRHCGDGQRHCGVIHRLRESLVRCVDRTQVSGRQKGRSLRKTKAGAFGPRICSFQFPPPEASARGEIARPRIAGRNGLNLLHIFTCPVFDRVTCGRGSNWVAERAKKQVAGLLRGKRYCVEEAANPCKVCKNLPTLTPLADRLRDRLLLQ
jgi:hypothetical protein